MPSRKAKLKSQFDLNGSKNSSQDGRNGLASELVTARSFVPPPEWPSGISYLKLPSLSPWLGQKHLKWLQTRPKTDGDSSCQSSDSALPLIRLPLCRNELDDRVIVKRIEQPEHPAHGQFGLFAGRKLVPGELIIPYIGYVHSSTASEQAQYEAVSQPQGSSHYEKGGNPSFGSQDSISYLENPYEERESLFDISIGSWDNSSYDLNMFRDGDLELAVDASQAGNEARFCNDYRGVPLPENLTNVSIQSIFDRKTKRSAKSWGSSPPNEDQVANNFHANMSIPNAEFRDVWFQWDALDEEARAQEDQGELSPPDTHSDCELSQSRRSLEFASARERRRGLRGVAIFVLPAGKSGKRKNGISPGQEILVSYGKGFWAHHCSVPPDSELPQ